MDMIKFVFMVFVVNLMVIGGFVAILRLFI